MARSNRSATQAKLTALGIEIEELLYGEYEVTITSKGLRSIFVTLDHYGIQEDGLSRKVLAKVAGFAGTLEDESDRRLYIKPVELDCHESRPMYIMLLAYLEGSPIPRMQTFEPAEFGRTAFSSQRPYRVTMASRRCMGSLRTPKGAPALLLQWTPEEAAILNADQSLIIEQPEKKPTE